MAGETAGFGRVRGARDVRRACGDVAANTILSTGLARAVTGFIAANVINTMARLALRGCRARIADHRFGFALPGQEIAIGVRDAIGVGDAGGEALTGGGIAAIRAAVGADGIEQAQSESIAGGELRDVACACIGPTKRSRSPNTARAVTVANAVLLAGALGIRDAFVLGVRARGEVAAFAVEAASFELR